MLVEPPIPNSWASIKASTLWGRLSNRFWNLTMGLRAHTATRALLRCWVHGCWARSVCVQLVFQFVLEVFCGVKVRVLCRYSTPTLSKYVFMYQRQGFSGTGLGLLVPLKGNWNATAYMDILRQFWGQPFWGRTTYRCVGQMSAINCINTFCPSVCYSITV